VSNIRNGPAISQLLSLSIHSKVQPRPNEKLTTLIFGGQFTFSRVDPLFLSSVNDDAVEGQIVKRYAWGEDYEDARELHC
jgi:hypothetical protein